jgi:GDP-4-dehydro-6-deoxy-D-mannose reductase
MAALSSVAASWREPMRVLNDNTAMQLNLLEALRRWTPSCRTVVAGSCDEYGWKESTEPITEGAPLLPVTPYALSKVTQDLMGYQFFHAFGLPVIRLRPFLQLGPRRSPIFVAGSFAKQIAEIELGFQAPLLEVGNIDLRRDFTDVRDVARACLSVAGLGRAGEAYNIASGSARSIREMVDIMVQAADVRAKVVVREELKREGEPEVIVGSAAKLRRETGWKPTISFEQSAIDTLEYWRARVARSRVAQGERR